MKVFEIGKSYLQRYYSNDIKKAVIAQDGIIFNLNERSKNYIQNNKTYAVFINLATLERI